MGVPCEILWDYVRPCQAVGQKESGLLAATWLSMYIHLTLDMHMQPVCPPVLPCPTMSYLLPFIVQAYVMMLDGMSCAGHELQCTIWQQPRRFPGGTVCKAFACFGIYVPFPLIVLQTFENISLWCPPQTSRNIQKHPETIVLCFHVFSMSVVSGWSREGRSWERHHHRYVLLQIVQNLFNIVTISVVVACCCMFWHALAIFLFPSAIWSGTWLILIASGHFLAVLIGPGHGWCAQGKETEKQGRLEISLDIICI